mmetsp:Transcript_15264/g.50137  ORF Transcript_15264/g.50137 Transcript_15264/m.50137 type:complete len:212 (-) Transcript_15264:1600-2235(-)
MTLAYTSWSAPALERFASASVASASETSPVRSAALESRRHMTRSGSTPLVRMRSKSARVSAGLANDPPARMTAANSVLEGLYCSTTSSLFFSPSFSSPSSFAASEYAMSLSRQPESSLAWLRFRATLSRTRAASTLGRIPAATIASQIPAAASQETALTRACDCSASLSFSWSVPSGSSSLLLGADKRSSPVSLAKMPVSNAHCIASASKI